MSAASFKGKLLEEVLVFLIRNSGYRLLVDPIQDPDELEQRGNGLVVRGRGAVHQADVLGQLGWIPAFTFPIRLFVEAKWHGSSKIGLLEVRNAVGVLQDINQNYSVQNADFRPRLIRRFNYTYALFSTTGFTAPAEEMALAHLISSIDLSGPEFADLRSVVNDLGDLLYSLFEDEPDVEGDGAIVNRRTERSVLAALRERLGTWPVAVPSERWKDERVMARLERSERQIEPLLHRIRDIGELFVGMAKGAVPSRPTGVGAIGVHSIR